MSHHGNTSSPVFAIKFFFLEISKILNNNSQSVTNYMVKV